MASLILASVQPALAVSTSNQSLTAPNGLTPMAAQKRFGAGGLIPVKKGHALCSPSTRAPTQPSGAALSVTMATVICEDGSAIAVTAERTVAEAFRCVHPVAPCPIRMRPKGLSMTLMG